MCPLLLPLTHSHTAKPHHHATHTHTRGGWCTLVPGVCVCAHGVGCGRAWLATHTSTHSLCPTPHHSSSCCCWWWWMWWWQRGCCGVCGHLVHSLAVLVLSTPDSHTHTRGDGHVVVVAVCVVWLPPPLCAFPTNHHHCVRCPALSAVCVSVSGGTTHTRPLWCHPRWCVCVSERRGHHTHHPRCRPMCPLSPLTRHATPATLSQMPRLTSLTHMACFVWLLPSTHTHWLADCPHALHTPPPLGVRVLIHLLSSATHTHTGRTGVAHAWVVAGVVTTTTPLVPHHHTHTHSGTGGVGHGGAWWCACALCVPPTPPSHSPSLPPPPTLLCHHHRPHTRTRDLVHAPLPHTHATCTTTHTKACCVLTTPCHTHHHPLHPPIHTQTTWHTHGISHTATMVLAIAHHAVHSLTQLMPHTPHRRQTKAKHTTGCGFS